MHHELLKQIRLTEKVCAIVHDFPKQVSQMVISSQMSMAMAVKVPIQAVP